MHKPITILLLILLVCSCSGHGRLSANKWCITQSNSTNQYFTVGMEIEITGNAIQFYHNDKHQKYPVIISENHMVIETAYTKWLFEIETKDSILVLRELYTKTPIVLSLTKINNKKKNKS